MVLIVTALPLEAAPIIERFKLKKDGDAHAYPVYRSSEVNNPEVSLIVSGVGKVRCAMAAVYLLASCGILGPNASGGRYSSEIPNNDIILNIGFCGAGSKRYNPGDLLVINKVTDMDTGRDYYPDVYFGRDLPKESLLCFSKPVGQDVFETQPNVPKAGQDFFCDMESAGFMEVVQKFFYSHQGAVIKIISDLLTPEKLDKGLLRSYMERNVPLIEQIISEMKCVADSVCTGKHAAVEHVATPDVIPAATPTAAHTATLVTTPVDGENYLLETIADNLHFSYAMRQILLKEIRKARLKGLQPLKTLELFAEIKVNSKSEGKKILERIIESLRQRPV